MTFGWIDIRGTDKGLVTAVVDAAIHARIDGVADDRIDTLATLPPTIRRVLLGAVGDGDEPDVLVVPVEEEAALEPMRSFSVGRPTPGALVHVTDQRTLDLAATAAAVAPYTVVTFKDATKIPLEIVIAAGDKSDGQLVCGAADLDEARIVVEVLEKGADGVLLAPRSADDVFAFAAMLRRDTPRLELTALHVESISHHGLGDRVCVDTCSHFAEDEGILVGSFSHGFILCCSETHPLPYMPTRPFRVNAGALHSYVVGLDNHTNYLSELASGADVLAVAADGRTRRVTVGRVKVESRPMLMIQAVSDDGRQVALTVQDDWHVRVLGPGGAVLNVTDLKPGDKVLGYLATDQRHVGWPVGEFCIEK